MPLQIPAPAQTVDWLRLWRLVQQSSPAVHLLWRHYRSPAIALAAAPADWLALGIAAGKAERLASWQYGDDPVLAREMEQGVAADLDWCAQPGHALLALDDPDYPALLRRIDDPPPLLFLKGDATLLHLPQLAVVGTRHPSLAGRADAEGFAGELARAGLVVTSGLARGVDAAAHTGALRSGGCTVAVLGTGPDRPYPRENTRLFLNIVEQGGLVVSEFLPGTPPLAMHFPRRNRLISGLSLGVLVVEAAPESGSLITARLAAEQGRLVWALPGSRHSVQAQGCLRLIREGVTAVTDVAQILGDLPPLLGVLREQARAPLPPSLPEVAPELRPVLEALGHEPRHPDWLIAALGRPAGAVLRALSQLEVDGHIAAVPGGYARLP